MTVREIIARIAARKSAATKGFTNRSILAEAEKAGLAVTITAVRRVTRVLSEAKALKVKVGEGRLETYFPGAKFEERAATKRLAAAAA